MLQSVILVYCIARIFIFSQALTVRVIWAVSVVSMLPVVHCITHCLSRILLQEFSSILLWLKQLLILKPIPSRADKNYFMWDKDRVRFRDIIPTHSYYCIFHTLFAVKTMTWGMLHVLPLWLYISHGKPRGMKYLFFCKFCTWLKLSRKEEFSAISRVGCE